MAEKASVAGSPAAQRRAHLLPAHRTGRACQLASRAASRRRRSSCARRSGSSRSAPCRRAAPWSCARRPARAGAARTAPRPLARRPWSARSSRRGRSAAAYTCRPFEPEVLAKLCNPNALEHPLQLERHAAALDDGRRARPGRGRRPPPSGGPPSAPDGAARAARWRRGWRARSASAGRRRARSRSTCRGAATGAVRTQSGRCAGACFSKKDLPSTPSGQRLTRQRPAGEMGQQTRRDAGVVVDQSRLVKPPRGYRSLSRFESFSSCPATSTSRVTRLPRREHARSPWWRSAGGSRGRLAAHQRCACPRAGPCRRGGAGCRRVVHSLNSISATSRGSQKTAPRGGGRRRRTASSRARSGPSSSPAARARPPEARARRDPRSAAPPPSSWTPTSSAPMRPLRAPSPGEPAPDDELLAAGRS